jgi:hypothetical protein
LKNATILSRLTELAAAPYKPMTQQTFPTIANIFSFTCENQNTCQQAHLMTTFLCLKFIVPK